jgi:hypothetical protein
VGFTPGILEIAIMVGGGLVCLLVTVGIIGLLIWLATHNKEET